VGKSARDFRSGTEFKPAPGGAVAEKFSKLGTPTLAGKARSSHQTHLALPAARIFRRDLTGELETALFDP
jgi:hypothetical protein